MSYQVVVPEQVRDACHVGIAHMGSLDDAHQSNKTCFRILQILFFLLFYLIVVSVPHLVWIIGVCEVTLVAVHIHLLFKFPREKELALLGPDFFCTRIVPLVKLYNEKVQAVEVIDQDKWYDEVTLNRTKATMQSLVDHAAAGLNDAEPVLQDPLWHIGQGQRYLHDLESFVRRS